MKIELEKSGGFAGIIKKVEVDTDNLDELQRHRIKRLLEECTSYSAKYKSKNKMIPKGSADYTVYKISIIDGKKIVNVEFNEHTIGASVRDLINQLMRYSAKK